MNTNTTDNTQLSRGAIDVPRGKTTSFVNKPALFFFSYSSFNGSRLIQLFLALLFILFISCNGGVTNGVSISIKAIDGLKYDVVRFKVKPGAKVELTLTNASDMSHNLLITKPGVRLAVVNTALQLAEKGPQMDFIPKSDDVLWSIPVVSPGQSGTIAFTAPSQPGIYPYVCTYPGHGFVMYGVMYVTIDETLPDITTDLNVPESRRQEEMAGAKTKIPTSDTAIANPHPYSLIPPYLYHVFLEGASPAAIAVNLPHDLSYCWDAGTCRLRFAWKGGFLDMSELWKGHLDASAKILGDIFFRDNTDFPIRVGPVASIPTIEYKGYRLVNKYPEFHYRLNSMDVYELIKEKADGFGLVRVFRIPQADGKIWFVTNLQDDAIEYEFSAGKFIDRRLVLSAKEAKEFTITMTSYHLAYKKNK
ncbi:MAG: plastocyanin/azurin family copper-binding protein [Ginsengibacter sp.]